MPSFAELDALLTLIGHLSAPEPPRARPPIRGLPAELVRRHLLAPLAYQAGHELFRRDFVASGLLAEVRARLAGEAIAALSGAGVRVILLKGISYAGHIYPDPASRPMTDIDLLVRADDHPRAVAALADLGYRPLMKPGARSAWHHATTLRGPIASIDLHRSMIQPLRSRVDLEGVWRRARPAAERTDGALRMAPVDEALFHLIHIARHELLVAAIAYVDAARLLARVNASGGGRELLCRAADWRLSRAIGAARAAVGALASEPGAGRERGALARWLLPHPREIAAGRRARRPLQLLRKAWLVEGPRELAGLVTVAAHARLTALGVANATALTGS